MSVDANIYDLQNIKCQLLLSSCETSSKSPRFAKGTVTNFNDVLRFRRGFFLHQSGPACMVVGRIFSSGGPKVVKLVFSRSELKNNLVLLKISKSTGESSPPLLLTPMPACGLFQRCITMLSDSWGCELSNFALILYLRHNGTRIQHSQCMQHAASHAFRAAMKLAVCCYDNRFDV